MYLKHVLNGVKAVVYPSTKSDNGCFKDLTAYLFTRFIVHVNYKGINETIEE